MVMNASVGAWGVNAVDLAPSPGVPPRLRCVQRCVLNLMGAYSSIIATDVAHCLWLRRRLCHAIRHSLAIFLVGLIFVIDENGIVSAKDEVVEIG